MLYIGIYGYDMPSPAEVSAEGLACVEVLHSVKETKLVNGCMQLSLANKHQLA